MEVKQRQESREGEHPATWEALQPWGDGSCSAPYKRPLCESPLPGSLGHKAPTAEAGSSSGLAGGWTSVAPWKVKKNKEKKKTEISPPNPTPPLPSCVEKKT